MSKEALKTLWHGSCGDGNPAFGLVPDDPHGRPVVVIKGVSAGAFYIRVNEVLLHPIDERRDDRLVDQHVPGVVVITEALG
jgi:hypothetical protein